ncbi:putative ATPase [Saccharothrix tamanrassetensis]|uniref:Putative ATPase n=1 Tax=Saccharothrix tamanrassetensis TaxID=1051531 RepID=A0A841CQK9_9PSEU|nr:ATP-binding protein [Saccharothrix tamanrassetensis]MBB5959183.1 putative ATPase [Saccharothrix tamanrassetensis]
MTTSRRPINPFPLPGWERTPMRPLRPWERKGHRDYYVDVDGAASAFQEFQQEIGDLTGLLEDGRLVLVTGDSGCGKTALVNRCADWTVLELRRRGMRGVVVDLTGCLPEDEELSIHERTVHVCDQLFDQLVDARAMRQDAEEALRGDRDNPQRIFPRLSRALNDDVVLVVLLPSPNELLDEVVRYARQLRSPRVLFFAESAFFDPDDIAEVVRRLESWVPPITLLVGKLDDGDPERFADDRLVRHTEVGIYPQLSDEAVELLSKICQSVAMLQRILHGTYERKLEAGLSYTEADLVTVDDIRAYLNGLGMHP